MAGSEKKSMLTIENVVDWIILLFIFSLIACVGNYVGFSTPVWEALPGMMILSLMTLLGLILHRVIPIDLPAIVYISIIGVLVALPSSPISNTIVKYTNKVSLLPICTVILAYSGIAIGKSWTEFEKMGWRGILVTVCVVTGTYLCSAVIAHIVLSMQGII
ncbi:MAG: hypothetical protein GX338_11045 [Firmicutes bacterium]|nr:hypothetical protein [Bacillota bacterium]